MLDELLQYHQEPDSGNFTRQVMGKIKKTGRTRQLILWLFGAIGFGFGIAGMTMLQGSLAGFAGKMVEQGPFGAPMIAMAAGLVLLGWLLNEAFE